MRKQTKRFTPEEDDYLTQIMHMNGYRQIFRERYPGRSDTTIYQRAATLKAKNQLIKQDNLIILEAEKRMWTIYFDNGARLSCLAHSMDGALELINPKLRCNIISVRSAADKD